MWAPYEEIEFSRIATPPAVLPSQFAHAIRWVPFQFAAQPFMGFEYSHDLFGDGSLVLVPMQGHTPGSVGLFLTLDDGRRFFFTGDTSWRLEGFTGLTDLVGASTADRIERAVAHVLHDHSKINY